MRAKHGAKEIVIGLGGSATNDGGFGMARALGFRFLGQPPRNDGLGSRGNKHDGWEAGRSGTTRAGVRTELIELKEISDPTDLGIA